MPCCGLTEYRRRVPLRLTVAGAVVFWSVFALTVLVGLATAWRRSGRETLRTCAAFLAALWRDTMRRPDSVPARWACRVSGYLLPVWPAAGEYMFRHPEVTVLAAPAVLFGAAFGGLWLWSVWP